MHHTKDGQLNALKLSSNKINIESIEFTSKESYREVYKVKW